ncbi:glycosyltransferase family 8 protein [uncultured Alistipes sp.]|uniref:glycosyltransferase family 8 protein n=1 Tax=uncultured Alistipes sp. TaxID=538949 RepID=UPI0027302E4E|nr:glycosyltransferase family 8 protein [uncultured Alistipes sp.]
MEILVCPDDGYAMPTGIMLISLFENNPHATINLHVIYTALSDENKGLLTRIAEQYGHKIAFYHTVPDSSIKFDGLHQQKISVSTYLRLSAHTVLPEEIDKVLYLDGDIIVRSCLQELWETEFLKNPRGGEFPLAAVADQKDHSGSTLSYNRLKIKPQYGYFNAGVLLLNLKYWRKHRVDETFGRILARFPEGLAFHDQDILNVAFNNNIRWLELTYNFMTEFFMKPACRNISWEFDGQIDRYRNNPAIVHFLGIKPWFRECSHPMLQEFLKYKSMSPWAGVRIPRLPMPRKTRIIGGIKKILAETGILQKPLTDNDKWDV